MCSTEREIDRRQNMLDQLITKYDFCYSLRLVFTSDGVGVGVGVGVVSGVVRALMT